MNYHYMARAYAPYVNRARVKVKRDYESTISELTNQGWAARIMYYKVKRMERRVLGKLL